MVGRQYILLLNSAVKAHLIGLSSREKRRLQEKFEFLENGLWDSGARVKKLKGISDKVIFEARSTGSDRILFTLGEHAGKTAIYLWGVVQHEEVQAEARRILPQNAPFLNFEPIAQEELTEVSIDDLPAEYFTTEDIAEKSPDDYGPQKWLILQPEEWKRILLSTDPDGMELFLFLTPEQHAVLRQDPPILLAGTAGSGKTTIAVYYLLGQRFADKRRIFLTYSPHLKRFSEQIHAGLIRHSDLEHTEPKPEFYVFRDLLLHILEGSGGKYEAEREVGLREFEEIFRQHKLCRKYDTELVWEEIRSIIKGAKPPISVNRFGRLVARYLGEGLSRSGLSELKEHLLALKHLEIMGKIEKLVVLKAGYRSYEEFLLALESGSASSSADHVPLVLQEILRILEKKSASFTDPLLTFQEYVSLGRKRAPNFVYDREEIYSVAQFYQGRLEAQGLWDEVDLCKKALQVLGPSSDRFLYDLVVCDEVQDFSDIQIALIFRLARDGRSVFLAGDPKQIINPSGFRWEEVRNKFYDRGVPVPGVLRLNLNFRCVGSIVKLSNALLDLKQQLVGLSDTELQEDWKFSGKPPVLVYGLKEEDFLARFRLTGAGQIVLTRSLEEQQKLKRLLGTELVFTVFEAKGLEFDSVLLWRFSEGGKSADLWRKICDGTGLDTSHHPHVRHELSLLYVAVTRARNTLVIYDGPDPGRVWSLDLFRDKLYRSSEKGVLTEVWQRISTPAEWESQGDYFFERQYYPAAVECYKNAGNSSKMEVAAAFVLEGEHRHSEAAPLFEKNGLGTRAADNYEKAGDYARALDLWEGLREEARARKCRIRLYEQRGDYAWAAEEWEKFGEYEKARENWEKAGNHAKIAQYHLARKEYGKAAEAFVRAKEYAAAASYYRKARKPAEAADCYFEAGDLRSAVAIYKKLKRPERLLQCYLALKDHHAAALLYEKAKRIEDAVGSFRRFAEATEENRSRLLAEAERYIGRSSLKSALRYSALSLYQKSAPIYVKKGFQERAILEYRTLQDHAGLADLYEKQGKLYKAALELEKAQEEGKWERVTYLLGRYIQTEEVITVGRPQSRNRQEEPAERLCREAETLFQSGARESALARFKAVRDPDGISRACLALGRHEEALLYFVESGLPSYGVRYLKEAGDFDISFDLLSRLSRSPPLTGPLHRPDIQASIDLVVHLLRKRLKTHRDEETYGLVEEFLSRFGYPYDELEEVVPDSYFELALESKSYNTIFRAVLSQKYLKNLSPRVRSFLEAVRKEGEARDDRNLLACYWYAHDKARYETLLGDLPLTGRNLEIFLRSVLHHGKAVDYQVDQGRMREAVLLCHRYRDYRAAGSILEKAGHFGAAGKEYREGKWYEDAMRCFRKVNDLEGIARVHEGMKQYGQAIAIWTRLGRQREVGRLRRKLGVLEQEPLKFK